MTFGCRHNFEYSQGYFRCSKCGMRAKENQFKRDHNKRYVTLAIIGLTIIVGIYAYGNYNVPIIDIVPVIDNEEELTYNNVEYEYLKISGKNDQSESYEEKIPLSKEKQTELEIQIPDIRFPIRAESGFNSDIIEDYIYKFTNDERQKRDITGLSRIDEIETIARSHSLDMSNRNYYSHDTPEGLDATDRGNKAGYDCRKDFGSYYTVGLGENIAQSYTYSSYMTKGLTSSYTWLEDEETLAKKLVDGWMNSADHRENILNKKYDRIGVGIAVNKDETVYATQNFC